MSKEKYKFQLMWEAHPMGVQTGRWVIDIFLKNNKYKEIADLIEENIILFYSQQTGTQFYYSVSEMQDASEAGYIKFGIQKKFQEWVKNALFLINESGKVYNDFLDTDIQKTDSKDLFDILKKYIQLMNKVYTYYMSCQPQYAEKLEKEVKENINSNQIFKVLTTSTKIDPVKVEEVEWLKIIRDFSGNELNEKIKSHADKYVSFGAVESGTPWNFEYYQKKLKDITKEQAQEEIEEIELKQRKFKEDYKSAKQEEIDPEISQKALNLAEIGWIRFSLRFAWTKISHMQIEISKEFIRRKINSRLTYENVFELTFKEFEKILFKNRQIDKEEIKKRKQAHIFVTSGGEYEFLIGEKAIKKKDEFIEKVKYNQKEITGAVACEGKVIGKVILFSWMEKDLTKKMAKMEEGSILVAGQTRPQLMPAIKKASAIVTDEGGITCHAAIVSRELGTPCIIGTKIGTKVLKNGMEVEVDADKGIVKII